MRSAPQEPVGNHGVAQVPLSGELTDAQPLLGDVSIPIDLDLVKRLCRQHPLRGDAVAELFDSSSGTSAADAGLAEQQMNQLVQERERPRRHGVLVVDDHEGGDIISDGETAKDIYTDGRVVTAEGHP